MSLCNRLIGGAVNLLADGIDVLASYWQTPREVEWAKAAAASGEPCEGCGHRIHDSNVCPVGECQCLGWFPDRAKVAEPKCGPNGPQCDDKWCMYCVPMVAPESSAPTPGAVDGPAEGEPPEPSAVVGAVCIVCFRPSGNCDCVERLFGPFPAHSAAVESPASVPAAESPHGEWRFTADEQDLLNLKPGDRLGTGIVGQPSPAPEFDWVTTAIPVIAGVLAEHMPDEAINGVDCIGHGETHGEFADWQDWRDHVAPHIAAALQTVCNTTVNNVVYNISLADEPLETISRAQEVGKFPSGDRPRPLADFPKHQNPRM